MVYWRKSKIFSLKNAGRLEQPPAALPHWHSSGGSVILVYWRKSKIFSLKNAGRLEQPFADGQTPNFYLNAKCIKQKRAMTDERLHGHPA